MNYILIIFLPTFLYLLEDLIPTNKKYFRKAGIFFIVIMTSLRYGFGADYFTYFEAFLRIQSGIFVDGFEPGYIFLNRIIGLLGLNFNFLLLVISIFNYILLYFAIENHAHKYKWLSLFLFLIYFDLFFYSLSAIRQSIVISIFLYSSKYIENKKPLIFGIWILFGSLFHWTSFILIPIYFLYHKLKKLTIKKAFSVVFISIIFYELLTRFLSLFRQFMSNRVEYYLFIFDPGIENNYLSATFMLIILLLWIYLITRFNSKKIGKDGEKKEDLELFIKFPMIAIMLYLILQVFQRVEYFSVIPRVQLYFYPFYIFAAPYSLKIFKVNDRKYLVVTMIFILSAYFIYRYEVINTYASEYYESFKLIFNI
jgi:hypothetical protein